MIKKVDPIRDLKAIDAIKKLTRSNPRDFLLFILGINNGLRISDLLALKVEDVMDKKAGSIITIKEKKTGKTNYLVINLPIAKAIAHYLNSTNPQPSSYLFYSRKGSNPLSVAYVNRMIKGWCRSVGLSGNYGCHSLRKTFGYVQRVHFGVGFEILCRRFNHSSPSITMRYLGIEDKEVVDILMNEI